VILLLLVAGLIGATDAAFLQAAQTYFTGGFNSEYVGGSWMAVVFLGLGMLLDLTWVLGVGCLLVPLLARSRGPATPLLVVVGVVAIAIPLSLTFSAYELNRVLGNMVSLQLLWEVSGRSMGEMISELLPHLPALAAVGVPLCLAAVALIAIARRLEARVPKLAALSALPSARSLLKAFALCLLLSSVAVILAANFSSPLWFGLKSKPNGMLLSRLIERVTDFDGDGFHLLSSLADPSPTDSSIHPWAVDLPGNRIDENGLAGDHPRGFRPANVPITVLAPADAPAARRPDFLLVYLESFRADLIGQELNGQEITPFLNRFSREGVRSDRVFVHTPNTAGSRANLFTGSTVLARTQTTLIDDFKARGYYVAHFSGQNDSFNDSEGLMGVERADIFFDARQALDQRSSRSTSRGGLQISWRVLNQHVSDFLDQYSGDAPLFLYVNFTDTHFPYHHDELENILGIEAVERNEISAELATGVWATYANAAANVDRGIEALVTRWRQQERHRDDAIMLLSDHGQAFYERGYLGHAQALTPEQTRTPLILSGIGGDWPEPLGHADIRGLLSRYLFRDSDQLEPRARFVPDPERRVYQVVPSSERPMVLALRGLEDSIRYDFRTGEFTRVDGDERPLTLTPEQREAATAELIRTWEANRLARSARE